MGCIVVSKSVFSFLSIGFLSVIIGFILEGGHMTALLAPTAAIIVFGGTIGAVGLSFPFEEMRKLPQILKVAFGNQKNNLVDKIIFFKEVSVKARKDGLLSIEAELQKNGNIDNFVKKGLNLIIDGIDPETVRSTLELQVEAMAKRHKAGAAIFESAGGFAPTMGIIGTVMGLVHVLGNLEDPSTLGPKIAVAFIATLYGVSTANLLYLPLASVLKAKNVQEINEKSLCIEAILLIQEGANPKMLEDKLKGFLNSEELEEIDKMIVGEGR